MLTNTVTDSASMFMNNLWEISGVVKEDWVLTIYGTWMRSVR